jgi:hypothetical protein
MMLHSNSRLLLDLEIREGESLAECSNTGAGGRRQRLLEDLEWLGKMD